MKLFIKPTKGRLFCGLLLSLFSINVFGSELSLLFGQERWHYTEADNNNVELDRETGWLNQVGITSLVQLTPHWLAHTQIQRTNGTLKYTGHTQAGQSHSTHTDTRGGLYTLTGRYYLNGYSPFSTRNFYFGTGIQHQTWSREIRAANGVSHLNEYYRWLGARLEAGYTQPLHPKMRLELGASTSWLIGSMEIDLTETPNTRHNFGRPTVKLNNGYEINSSLLLKWQLKGPIQLLVSYQIGYRYFPASNDITASNGTRSITLHEPKSSNYFHAVNLGLGYIFQ